MGAVASARLGQKETKHNDPEIKSEEGKVDSPKPLINNPPEKARRPVERRYSNIWAIR